MKSYYNIHTLWIVMLLLTLTTYAFGKLGLSGLAVVLFLLATAAIKGFIIIHDFMELRGVSLLWRVMMYGWLGVICLAIAISYAIT